jgi:hypothetical protein
MQIAAILIGALRERDPQEFNRLSRSGELEAWWKGRVRQANDIYNQLTEGAEKLPNGEVRTGGRAGTRSGYGRPDDRVSQPMTTIFRDRGGSTNGPANVQSQSF